MRKTPENREAWLWKCLEWAMCFEQITPLGGDNGQEKVEETVALGERYARERGYGLQVYLADWDAHGKAAGPMRNSEMVKCANAAVFFWDLQSKGTRDCIKKARQRKIPIRFVCYTLEPHLLELSDEVLEEWVAMKRRIYNQVEGKV